MSFKIDYGLFKLDIIDHYAILGIPVDASVKEIRKKYLKIAHSLHPDTCKAETEAAKQQASQILSKLVNPAYEHLSRNQSHNEYQLILSQLGKRLAVESGKITVASELARTLYKAESNLDLTYKKFVEQLAKEQYSNLDQVMTKIAQISELNLVYLMLKQGEGIRAEIKAPTGVSNTTTSSPITKSEPEVAAKASPVATYVRRAQEYMEKNNYAKAILELRDALELDPNHSTSHALMGLVYLKQNQLGMARVHINKAYQANPQDSLAIKAKQALDKALQGSKQTSGKSSEGGGSLFGGLFGGKKK